VSVEVVTFGCRLNAYESDQMRAAAQSASADNVIIINTCAVTAEAVRQARQTIRAQARANPQAQIVVTGCAAQTDPAMFANMPEVARVIGNDEKLQREGFQRSGGEKIAVGDIMRSTSIPLASAHQERARGFVQIQNGCDHRCTFCIITFGRGNSRSLPSSDVIDQARRLVETGLTECVLTGVDITSYRAADGSGLGALVKRILTEVPELRRLRLSSIDSVEADHELLDALANEPRLMPHLHLSLQAGDDLILKRMKRRHLRADAIAFCREVRRLRPDVVFGADLIAGFPTETEEMFARSLDLVAQCELVHLHVFPFSPRPGTPAARMPQVDRALIKERAHRLRERGEAALRVHLQAQVGSRQRVLAEQGTSARSEQFTRVRLAKPMASGRIIDVAISAHDGQQLIAA